MRSPFIQCPSEISQQTEIMNSRRENSGWPYPSTPFGAWGCWGISDSDSFRMAEITQFVGITSALAESAPIYVHNDLIAISLSLSLSLSHSHARLLVLPPIKHAACTNWRKAQLDSKQTVRPSVRAPFARARQGRKKVVAGRQRGGGGEGRGYETVTVPMSMSCYSSIRSWGTKENLFSVNIFRNHVNLTN